eukprot:5450572-Pyramimonas_sp.AAC.1
MYAGERGRGDAGRHARGHAHLLGHRPPRRPGRAGAGRHLGHALPGGLRGGRARPPRDAQVLPRVRPDQGERRRGPPGGVPVAAPQRRQHPAGSSPYCPLCIALSAHTVARTVHTVGPPGG